MPSDIQIEESIKREVVSDDAPKYITEARKPSKRVWTMLQQFYVKRQYKPAWVSGDNLSIEELIGAFCRADQEGLNPGNYSLGPLARLHARSYETDDVEDEEGAKRLAQLDLALTYAFFTYGAHLTNGYARPQWDTRRDSVRMDDQLQKALDQGTLREALAELLPSHEQYQRLKQALADYRRLESGWSVVKNVHDTDGLKQRLAATGDLGSSDIDDPERLRAAIKKFQARHGLTASGKLDGLTIGALNIPLKTRIRQLEINLERWRWLPSKLGDRYIMVNVPAYELQAVEQGETKLRMPVVVGQEYKPTPLFSERMRYIVLNPSWNIPESITKEEILPQLMTDPDYLVRNRIEVLSTESKEVVDVGEIDWESIDPEEFPYRLRQQPGEDNSLGDIKFLFPNEFNVYLHDTPARKLFERRKRDFSHGCVRVSRPYDLAAWVLKDSEWDRDSLQKAAITEEEKTIKLRDPLPVYILYWTCWVEDDGAVAFREDVYDQDRKEFAILPPQTSELAKVRELCRSMLEKVQD